MKLLQVAYGVSYVLNEQIDRLVFEGSFIIFIQ